VVLTVTKMTMLLLMMMMTTTFFLPQTMKNKSEKAINGEKNEKLERSCDCNFFKVETEECEWRRHVRISYIELFWMVIFQKYPFHIN